MITSSAKNLVELITFNIARAAAYLQQNIRKVLVASAMIMASCAFALIIFFSGSGQQKESLKKQYGHELASLLADQVSVMLADGNLIAMQASLGDIVEGESVLAAMVYDLAEAVVVKQTKQTVSEQALTQALSVSVPLTLNENYLGRLELHLEKGMPALSLMIVFLITLALLSGFTLLLLASGDAKILPDNKNAPSLKALSLTDAQVVQRTPTAILSIELNGFEALYKQLAAEARNQLFADIDLSISQIIALYEGELLTYHAGSISIAFFDQTSSNSEEDTTINEKHGAWFNGLCSGYLFAEIAKARKWWVQADVMLAEYSTKPQVSEHWNQWRSYKRKGQEQKEIPGTHFVIKSTKTSYTATMPFLSESAVDENEWHGFFGVHSLQQKYQRLLNKQLEQLLKT